ncbi:hypothetical protein HF086_008473, partial [Spodoptera exigua]
CSTVGLTSERADHDRRPQSKLSLSNYDIDARSKWTNNLEKRYINYIETVDEVKINNNHKGNEIQMRNLDIHKSNVERMNSKMRNFEVGKELRRVKRDDKDPRCESFNFDSKEMFITHPHPKNSGNNYYYNNSDCVTKINATTTDMVIQLTFVDVFRIEYHPECAYDYLEIRDGYYGYADLMGRFCGQAFPRTLKTKGPNVWLKFHSDDTIEYEGFKINIEFKPGPSHHIPEECYTTFDEDKFGVIDTKKIDPLCLSNSNQALDIYLNFTQYGLAKPNECNENIIQVFETVHEELDSKLAEYCGSVANSVTTKDRNGNVMYVRLYVAKDARKETSFKATFNAFRTLDANSDGKWRMSTVTYIFIVPQLKQESTINQPHIMVILIIFSLILSGMSFVFIFKCMRKLYQDHKIIKFWYGIIIIKTIFSTQEHIRQSCEDRLDSLVGSRLTLDPKRLQRDSEPRVSLERENHNNEMVKKQRSFSSKHKQSSIESDYQETHLDLDEEIWRREVDSMPIEEDVSIERNGRARKSDFSRKEESMRSRTKESEDSREKKEMKEHKREIRDVSVGAPDTKESGCQTRESLFQTDPPPSSDGKVPAPTAVGSQHLGIPEPPSLGLRPQSPRTRQRSP